MKIKLKRSDSPGKRPKPEELSPGELTLNYYKGEPGLYFKDSDFNTVKLGPIHVGSYAPNSEGFSDLEGQQGNSVGEAWMEPGSQTLRIWSGSEWLSATSALSSVIVSETHPRYNIDGKTLKSGDLWLEPNTENLFSFLARDNSEQDPNSYLASNGVWFQINESRSNRGVTDTDLLVNIPDSEEPTSTVWNQGSMEITSTGCLEVSLSNVDEEYSQGPLSVENSDTLWVRWKPSVGCGLDPHGSILTGVVVGFQKSMRGEVEVDRVPSPFSLPNLTNINTSTLVTSASVRLLGFNFSTKIWSPASTSGTVELSVNGGSWVTAPTTFASALELPYSDLPSLQVRHVTSGGTGSTDTTTIRIGSGETTGLFQEYVWSTTNLTSVNSVGSPAIALPVSESTVSRPAVNLSVSSTAYSGNSGAGSHTRSDWESWRNSYPLESANSILSVDSTSSIGELSLLFTLREYTGQFFGGSNWGSREFYADGDHVWMTTRIVRNDSYYTYYDSTVSNVTYNVFYSPDKGKNFYPMPSITGVRLDSAVAVGDRFFYVHSKQVISNTLRQSVFSGLRAEYIDGSWVARPAFSTNPYFSGDAYNFAKGSYGELTNLQPGRSEFRLVNESGSLTLIEEERNGYYVNNLAVSSDKLGVISGDVMEDKHRVRFYHFPSDLDTVDLEDVWSQVQVYEQINDTLDVYPDGSDSLNLGVMPWLTYGDSSQGEFFMMQSGDSEKVTIIYRKPSGSGYLVSAALEGLRSATPVVHIPGEGYFFYAWTGGPDRPEYILRPNTGMKPYGLMKSTDGLNWVRVPDPLYENNLATSGLFTKYLLGMGDKLVAIGGSMDFDLRSYRVGVSEDGGSTWNITEDVEIPYNQVSAFSEEGRMSVSSNGVDTIFYPRPLCKRFSDPGSVEWWSESWTKDYSLASGGQLYSMEPSLKVVINGLVSDGFRLGWEVEDSASGNKKGTLSEVTETYCRLTGSSGDWGSAVGGKIKSDTSNSTQILNLTDDTSNLTSVSVPRADLPSGERVYTKVRHGSATVKSDWSEWSAYYVN